MHGNFSTSRHGGGVAMCLALIVCFFAAQGAMAARWYVDINASPNGNGQSWGTAFDDLHDALDNLFLVEGDEIWVAAGTYVPTEVSPVPDVGIAFTLREEVRLYGGFAGSETSLADRQIINDQFVNETILTSSGVVLTALDIGGGFRGFTGQNTTVNGFTIRDANLGAWLFYSAPVFIRCRFIENTTGVTAHGNFDEEGANLGPEFINCQFVGNNGGYKAAGVDLDFSDGTFTNCLFADNVSNTCCGAGAVWMSSSTSTFANSTFFRNTLLYDPDPGSNGGGGIHVGNNSDATIINSIFWKNRHGTSGDIGGEDAQIFVFTGSTVTVDYTIVEDLTGNFGGQGNIDDDPLFVSESTADLRLQNHSPAINAGRNAAVPGDNYNIVDLATHDPNRPTPEMDLGKRVINGIVDMGPYEYMPEGDLAGTASVGMEDMEVLLSNYNCEGECLGDFNLDGKVDEDDVVILLELMEEE